MPDIKSIDHKHLNKFMILKGTIVRVSKPKNRELEGKVQGVQGNAEYTVQSEIFENNRLVYPPQCTEKVVRTKNPIYAIGRKIIDK